MGFFDSLSDMLEAALPWSQAEAEAPKEDDSEEKVRYCFLDDARYALWDDWGSSWCWRGCRWVKKVSAGAFEDD
jgi:hypothetical protein